VLFFKKSSKEYCHLADFVALSSLIIGRPGGSGVPIGFRTFAADADEQFEAGLVFVPGEVVCGHDFFAGAIFEEHGEHRAEEGVFGEAGDVLVNASGQLFNEVFNFRQFIGCRIGSMEAVLGERFRTECQCLLRFFSSLILAEAFAVDATDQPEEVTAVSGLLESAVDESFVEAEEHFCGNCVSVDRLYSSEICCQPVGVLRLEFLQEQVTCDFVALHGLAQQSGYGSWFCVCVWIRVSIRVCIRVCIRWCHCLHL
jgi:hypothetical protein